jgi:anti-sigma factor RsiW
MSDCRRTAERLTPYTDDALPQHERADVERHLDKCPPCRTAAVHEQGGRTVLRECAAQLKAQPLPPGLRSRCEALARHHGSRRRAFSRALLPAVAAALGILVAIGAGLYFVTPRSNTLLAAQLTADHMKCFRVLHEPSPAPADSRQVERQLEDDYGWDVHLPPSSASEGIQLIGARRCLYANGVIPHVMYRVHGQPVSLYMLEGVHRPPAEVMALGHRSEIWSRGETTYVLVSASSSDITRVARYVKQEAH